ncbi:Integral membrane [Fusarium albosuccineum]|uniref:Integral membrane n=1 Tax=Fusarium albosuccineum TaxID=1237068 RepID=A0A8H4LE34_9HYPO|nr:Integral membrane [Fusarium albosuccineum]
MGGTRIPSSQDPPSHSMLTNTQQLFSVATVFIGFRLYSRIQTRRVGLWADDWILIAGWIFVLVATAIVTWLMIISATPGNMTKIIVARCFHNLQSIALGLTKTSFGVTLLRLMPGGWEAKVIWVLIVTMNLQFAIHIIATWQAICGAPDDAHIGGDHCWQLKQSVTFAVFSAVYSALCDFILALLPWKMVFNLQMNKTERISVAAALSMGVLAGVTGINKAVQGYKLLDVRSPDYMYTQAVYWIWSMAEPNVTIISASIPVLRGFVRNVRNRSGSSPGTGAYMKTGNSSSRFNNRSHVHTTEVRADAADQDGASDRSILGRGPEGGDGGGITWTTEVSVEYEAADMKQPAKGAVNVEEFEMRRFTHRRRPSSVQITSQRANAQ